MMELGRAVSRADDEGHPTLMRLDHRRMELGGGGAARDAQDGGLAAGHGKTDGEETGTALVQANVHPESGVERQGQRRRAGARAHDGVGNATVDPLVDQGGGEGGLYAHPTCPSMSNDAAAARPWCCSTASPRRAAC